MASARELLARSQRAAATRLLLEVREPYSMRGWVNLALDVLAKGMLRSTLRGHEDQVVFAAWSPDGKRIATASEDLTARVWTSDGTGTAIVLNGHKDRVKSAAWSPDGKRILTASLSTVRIWPLFPLDIQQALRDATTECLSPAERQTYLDESDAAARDAYEVCERSYDRTPFFPPP
jgi:WD40 repeat protein